MLYQLSYSRVSCRRYRSLVGGGGGRIRTSVGVRRQIYSLLPLAAREPLHAIRPSPAGGRLFNFGATFFSRLFFPNEKNIRVNLKSGKTPIYRETRCSLGPRQHLHDGLPWGLHGSWRWDSNPQPADYKSAALPIELRQRDSSRLSQPHANNAFCTVFCGQLSRTPLYKQHNSSCQGIWPGGVDAAFLGKAFVILLYFNGIEGNGSFASDEYCRNNEGIGGSRDRFLGGFCCDPARRP